MEKFKMHTRVEILDTNEVGFIVWFDEEDPDKDSFLIEIEGKCEMPHFYKRKDFRIIDEE